MTREELIELLADKEHASWARWMDYLFSRCPMRSDGSAIIPFELVERWKRQIETGYQALTDTEKQSDRDEVAHILPIIDEYAGGMTINAVNHTVDRLVARPLDLIDQAKLVSAIAVLDEKVSRLQSEVFSAE